MQAYKKYDPCEPSSIEILLLYPGIKALALHRVAHALYKLDVPFFPRLISEFSRWLTGIDIHPGAQIGENFVIDHGMGVVIGETSVIGNDVLMFHEVTLGGSKFIKGQKRHPNIGNKVVIGAGAKILGNISIGDCSRIGANSVVVDDIPAHSTVVGNPGKIIDRVGVKPGHELCHDEIKGDQN